MNIAEIPTHNRERIAMKIETLNFKRKIKISDIALKLSDRHVTQFHNDY
jgi:hypothetical protein